VAVTSFIITTAVAQSDSLLEQGAKWWLIIACTLTPLHFSALRMETGKVKIEEISSLPLMMKTFSIIDV